MITIGIMIVFFALFLVLVNVLDNKSINGIKAKQVGDGQHGTTRWATNQEIRRAFFSLPFEPSLWRQGKNLPKIEGTVVACRGNRNTTALVDTGDVHNSYLRAALERSVEHVQSQEQEEDMEETDEFQSGWSD